MGHAIGIDLGTTYSAAAILQADGNQQFFLTARVRILPRR